MMEEKKLKTKAQSDQLSDSDTPDEEADPQLCTTQAALSHSRVQTNPTIERGPPRRPKIKKLSKDKAAEKGTQTKDKEK